MRWLAVIACVGLFVHRTSALSQGTTLPCGTCSNPPISSPNAGSPGVGWFGAGSTADAAISAANANMRAELGQIYDNAAPGFACEGTLECICFKYPTYVISGGPIGTPQEVSPGTWWVTLEYQQAAVSVCCTEC